MMDAIVYTTPSCPWCVKARDFLKDHNIKFKEVDISDDLAAANEMMKKSSQMGVPVITVGDKVIVGFDEGEIKKAFGIKQ